MRHLFLLLTLLPTISTLQIVFYLLLIAKSHIDFTDSLINTLVEKGHTVDLIIARLNSHVTVNGTDKIDRRYGYGFTADSPWSKTPYLLEPFKKRVRTFTEHTHFMRITTELCEIGLSDPGLHEFMKTRKYDVGIVSEYEYCGFALFDHYKIPSIASFNSLAVLDQQAISAGLPNPAAVTHSIVDAEDTTKLYGRFWNLLNWAHINFFVYPYCQQHSLEVIHKYLNPNIKLDRIIQSIDINFINSNELIERPRPISHKMKYIGGINLRKPKVLDEETERIMALPAKGAVIFCFGTQVPSAVFPKNIRQSFVNAINQFPEYNFIWKYEKQPGDDEIFKNSTNLYLMKWLPQTDLLYDSRTKGFISHVGLNSYLEASYAGVPILAVPLIVDQPHNAMSGEAIGTTYVLDKTDLTTENIVKGIKAMLYDQRYTLNAKRVAKMLQDRPNTPQSILTDWVEFIGANPLLHQNLNQPGVDMSVFTYYSMDVISISLSVIMIISYISYRLIIRLVSKIGKLRGDRKQKIQ